MAREMGKHSASAKILNKNEDVTGQRFRYASFAERLDDKKFNLAAIELRSRRGKRRTGDGKEGLGLEETGTYFAKGVQHWSQYNLTIPFAGFVQSVSGYCQTLAQLYHHQNQIVAEILLVLNSKDDASAANLAGEPVLDLTVKLAQDLGEDFMVHYKPLVQSILNVASHAGENTESIEHAFTALVLLFKHLRSVLIKDLPGTLDILNPYLGLGDGSDKATDDRAQPVVKVRPYMKRFTAESFAYLLRKAGMPELQSILSHLFQALNTSQDSVITSIANILSEAIKGTEKRYQSRSEVMLGKVFDAASTASSRMDSPIPLTTVQELLIRLCTALAHHGNAKTMEPLVNLACEQAQIAISIRHNVRLVITLSALLAFTGTRKGYRILRREPIYQVLGRIESNRWSEEVRGLTNLLTYAIITTSSLEEGLSQSRALLEQMIERTSLSDSLLLSLALCRSDWQYFERLVLPIILSRLSLKPFEVNQGGRILFLLLECARRGHLKASSWRAKTTSDTARLREHLKAYLAFLTIRAETDEYSGMKQALLLGLFLSDPIPLDEDILQGMLNIDEWTTRNDQCSVYVGRIMHLASRLPSSSWTSKLLKGATTMLEHHLLASSSCNVSAVCSLAAKHPEISLSLAPSAVDHARNELAHPDRRVRTALLNLLRLHYKEDEVSQDIIKMCLELEDIPLDLEHVRDKFQIIRRLIVKANQKEDGPLTEIIIRVFLALFAANFKPLWTEAEKMMTNFNQTHQHRLAEIALSIIQRYDDADNLSAHKTLRYLEEPLDPPVIFDKSNTFSCPALQSVRSRIEDASALLNEDLNHSLEVSSTAMRYADRKISDRIDAASYYEHLLIPLRPLSSQVEAHHRIFSPLLINFYHKQYRSEKEYTIFDARRSHSVLVALMNLNKLFKSSQSMVRNSELRQIYGDLLITGDMSMQALTLDCILTWREDGLLQHTDHLRNLLNENTFKQELASLASSIDQSATAGSRRTVLLQVVMRILYGRLISRKAKGSSSRGMQSRRVAIFNALGAFASDSIAILVQLMSDQVATSFDKEENQALRQQIGFLTLTKELMERIAVRALPSWDLLLSQIVRCAQYANSRDSVPESKPAEVERLAELTADRDDLESSHSENDLNSEPHPASAKEDEIGSSDSASHDGVIETTPDRKVERQAKAVCRLSLSVFTQFFKYNAEPEILSQYLPDAYSALISHRIPDLHLEAAQGPSSSLRLLEAWANTPKYHHFFLVDDRICPSLANVLTVSNVKSSSVDLVVEILSKIMFGGQIGITAHLPHILSSIARYLELTNRKQNDQDATIVVCELLVKVAPFCHDSNEKMQLTRLLVVALSYQSNKTAESLKVALLKAFLSLVSGKTSTVLPLTFLQTILWDTLVKSLTTMRSIEGRQCIVNCLKFVAERDPSYSTVTSLITDLNAMSPARAHLPDFDARLKAFASITKEGGVAAFSPPHASALLSQMIFSLHDAEEMSIRNNASVILRDYIRNDSNSSIRLQVIRELLLPAFRRGLKTKSEEVRSEILQLLGCIVTHSTELQISKELLPLIPDDESSFFSNFCHIQKHRRVRAIDRLAKLAHEQAISSSTVNGIFLPLITQVLNDSSESDAHVFNECVISISALCRCVTWPSYRRMATEWIAKAKEKDGQGGQKRKVRVLVSILEGFHFYTTSSEGSKLGGKGEDVADDMSEHVHQKLIPSLTEFMRQSEDTDVLLRVPIAVGLAHLIKGSPDHEYDSARTLFTTVCQILRSRSQETRDATRDTLHKLITYFGASKWSLLVQELKASLRHGSQYHILSYTLHWLLVKSSDQMRPGDLDETIPLVVDVITHDIFSDLAIERQDKEYLSKLKERKGNKSFDTLEICSSAATVSSVTSILLALKKVMGTVHTPKDLQYLDEAMRRVATGLNRNKNLDSRKILSVSHELITQNVAFLKPHLPSLSKSMRANEAQYIVQTKREATRNENHYDRNATHFVTLGMDLLRHAIKSGQFDLNDGTIMSMLNTFPAALGDSLYSDQELIIVSSIRLLQDLLRLPLPALVDVMDGITKRIMVIVGDGSILFRDSHQVALRFLATVIRDRKEIAFEDWQLENMIQSLKVGLEQPENRMNCFGILRAILSRKFLAASIYDVMDSVAVYLVTDQNSQVREISRNAILQFLLDYPQGRNRLRKIMAFLTSNLSYVYESGRLSVLEILGAFLTKFGDDIIEPFQDSLFLSLFMTLVNDDSSKCRDTSVLLLKVMISKFSADRVEKSWQLAQNWLRSDEVSLSSGAMICMGLFAEAKPEFTLSQLDSVLASVVQSLSNQTRKAVDPPIATNATRLLLKLLVMGEHVANRLIEDGPLQKRVLQLLTHEDSQTRTVILSYIGQLFSKRGPSQLSRLADGTSIFNVDDMINLAYLHLDILKDPKLTKDQGSQLSRNLVYIIRVLPLTDGTLTQSISRESDASDIESDANDEAPTKQKSPVRSILTSLSMLSRRTRLVTLDYESGELPHTYIVQVFASISQLLEKDVVKSFLPHMLNALYRISCDDTAAPSESLSNLKMTTGEVMDLLQEKCGTSTYLEVYAKVRQSVQATRVARKEKRSVLELTEPEQAARRKLQRGVMKKSNASRKADRHRQGRLSDQQGTLRVRKTHGL